MPRLIYPLSPAGLAVPVLVGLDGKTSAALHAAGRTIPPPVHARGLLDTCSDLTAVASWILPRLAIPPTTNATTLTAAGPVAVRLYEISLSIADAGQSGKFLLTAPNLLVSELAAVLPDADVRSVWTYCFRGSYCWTARPDYLRWTSEAMLALHGRFTTPNALLETQPKKRSSAFPGLSSALLRSAGEGGELRSDYAR